MRWLQARLNSLLDNFIFTILLSGGAAVVAWIKELSWCAIIGISLGIFIAVFFILRLASYLQLRLIIKRLLSVGVFTDVPGNILRILYYDKESLKIGLPDHKVLSSNQDKQVYADFRLHNIVQIENRSTGSYWVLTDIGERVISYLEKNQQVLNKEGSRHK
jgi:hypothetical protein